MTDFAQKPDSRTYIAIDLKSFYASVECAERNLDPLTTNLVVADASRTEKTICLAVSPSLKACGIPGRPRLFEVVQKMKEVNAVRLQRAPGHRFTGSSCSSTELSASPQLAADYIVAPPRMSHYMECSTAIYNIYLKYIAPEDIHVYSIDEVFMDVTGYLDLYHLTARELAMKMILDVLNSSGITATAGIGTNLYLCKVAMDIEAKHIPPDENGVRIAQLDEMSYRRSLWTHRPLTDFWRIGPGYAKKLEHHGMYTMGDIARCSLGGPSDCLSEELLYRLFGVNAELLIDHAWGWEPCTIADIKAYLPASSSAGSGQVLSCPYSFEDAKLVALEMADGLALDLVDRHLVTSQIVLTIGYDTENLADPQRAAACRIPAAADHYGRMVPRPARGSVNLPRYTSSGTQIVKAVSDLFDRIADRNLLIRRLNLTAEHVLEEKSLTEADLSEQLSLFEDCSRSSSKSFLAGERAERLEKEEQMQQTLLDIKKKYGKNSILKGTSLEEASTAMERNRQIGGHKA
ncbi:MAG: DNA methylase [Firmicutes bacterium]|nr:DNA methylase [Bacillota bacterium]MDD7601586.1 DNA methylase [Bacillota bacterium]MDY5857473.1 DNA methylase [Anaerovoracaceae bacterium]